MKERRAAKVMAAHGGRIFPSARKAVASVTLSSLLALPVAAAAEDWSVTVAASDSRISGARTYGTAGVTDSSTGSDAVPFVGLRYRASAALSVDLGYAYVGGLTTRRTAPSSDIFGQGGPAGAVLTPYRIEEDIHQISLAFTLTLPVADGWTLDLGPSLDAFASRATVSSEAVAARRRFSTTDYAVGGRAALEHRFSDGWGWAVFYRYLAPPERRVSSLGVELVRRF